MGETQNEFAQMAKKKNFEHVILVKDMHEAVSVAFEVSEPGDAILLSPACASWDMYQNFEARGDHFKKCVYDLKKS